MDAKGLPANSGSPFLIISGNQGPDEPLRRALPERPTTPRKSLPL